MYNATHVPPAMSGFRVYRRCADRGSACLACCNCGLLQVLVEVDDLTDTELADFLASGTPEQREELEASLRAEENEG